MQNDWTDGYRLASTIQFHFPECQKVELVSIITRASSHGIILLEDLLRWDPEKRPTAQQSLKYSFFQVIPLPPANGRLQQQSQQQQAQQQHQQHQQQMPIEKKPNFSMSPLESARNKQFARLSHFNNSQQNKIIQQKQLILENNIYNFASSANSMVRKNELDSNDAKPPANNYVTENLIINKSVSNYSLGTQDSKNSHTRERDELVKVPPKANKSNNTERILERNISEEKLSKETVNNGSANTIKNFNNNEDLVNSLNESIDFNASRRFSIRRSSRLPNEDDIIGEKISDIYVNRNINNLYGHFENSNDGQASTNQRNMAYDNHFSTNHNKGFFLHNNGHVNGENMTNGAESKVYHVFTKQREKSRELVEKQRTLEEMENEYLATKFSHSSIAKKQQPKYSDSKRASIGKETWGSFEEDELASILG